MLASQKNLLNPLWDFKKDIAGDWTSPAVNELDTVASLVACNSCATETFRNVQISENSQESIRLFLLYNKNLIFCCVYICKSMNTGLTLIHNRLQYEPVLNLKYEWSEYIEAVTLCGCMISIYS